MAANVDGVNIVDAEMERHLKRAIDKEDAKVEPKKTKTGDDILPEISIDEDISIVEISSSREKDAVMARVAKDNNIKKKEQQ
ncbi:hypothetical protein PRIPAC_95325 [Pristionchus pacificus]|uniref:Uncharacterized protein n=1 Tax=Pristionchus pacificus TaxID=54126 RepID=A0A2A6CUM8_PRIPA|nr:hypothetical protein PRIPAC_95325 [Pristionchus pacificus]|eukprot:PDM81721.1 hypothetical protein PRIPAC_30702 [Pristionchus pacificus]